MTKLTIAFIGWGCFTVGLMLLTFYRRWLEAHNDHFVHLAESESAALQQQEMCNRALHRVERLGESLTIFDVVSGVMLFAILFYQVWTTRGM